jgi:hypothetical protein
MSCMVPFWAYTDSGSVPHFGAPTPEATLLRRRMFIVLMTAAHISPNVFSLQLSLSSVYWTSYYNIQQCIHTHYTSHSHNLILYYIILHNTLTSILHLHFFCSLWQAGCPRLIVSDTLIVYAKKQRRTRCNGKYVPVKGQSKAILPLLFQNGFFPSPLIRF